MRRNCCEITNPQDIERILNSTTIGRLAPSGADGYPYITPVNFVYHDGNIYFHSASKGEKLDNLARDPKVCFEVDIPLAYLDKTDLPFAPILSFGHYSGKCKCCPGRPLEGRCPECAGNQA